MTEHGTRAAFAEVLDLLDVRRTGRDRSRGDTGVRRLPRLFGGQAVAQALEKSSCGKVTEALPPHVRAWVEARKRHRLAHAQVQMARELGWPAPAEMPWPTPPRRPRQQACWIIAVTSSANWSSSPVPGASRGSLTRRSGQAPAVRPLMNPSSSTSSTTSSFRRLAEADTARASQLFRRLLNKPSFSWERDGEALLRKHKPWCFGAEPQPPVTPLSSELAGALPSSV